MGNAINTCANNCEGNIGNQPEFVNTMSRPKTQSNQ